MLVCRQRCVGGIPHTQINLGEVSPHMPTHKKTVKITKFNNMEG